MKKRQTPITSILAHESIKESKQAMYVKIVAGLEKLRVGGTFVEISVAAGMKPEQVWKRLSEMQRIPFELVFKTGITRPGTSGRQCAVWQLTRFQNKLTVVPKTIQQELF